MKIFIIGAGAAGFFAALEAKKNNPKAEVVLLEKTAQLLSKVKISGGGRCNVTHACFDPKELIQNYPRGSRELLGLFNKFQPTDTIHWFKERGVILKKEKDGRMFPISNSSVTIINCFLEEAKKLGVKIQTKVKIDSIIKTPNGFILTIGEETLSADRLILATGSGRSGWEFAKSFGHTIVEPVPSLFTFNIPSFPLVDIAGVSCKASIKLKGTTRKQEGPLLITHWGFSGPAALKLSAFAARVLFEKKYETPLLIDWLPDIHEEELNLFFKNEKIAHPSKQLSSLKMYSLPKNLYKALVKKAGLEEMNLNSLSKSKLSQLVEVLKRDLYQVKGKTTNKEEFVTCGGIRLAEVQFKTMESKHCPHLYFCGEILNIDGVTGGFNFQNAWTTGYIAGRSAAIDK